MFKSDSTIKLAPALLRAQKQVVAVIKDSKNPFFKSSYASLGAYIDAVKEALNDNDIIVLQPMSADENGVYVETTLLHTSGEWLSSKLRIEQSKQSDPQAQGSAITYARRYSLGSLLTLDAEDDDGERAMNRRSAQSMNLSQIKAELRKYVPEIIPEEKADQISKLSLTKAAEWLAAAQQKALERSL